jgi:hypothetical protein
LVTGGEGWGGGATTTGEGAGAVVGVAVGVVAGAVLVEVSVGVGVAVLGEVLPDETPVGSTGVCADNAVFRAMVWPRNTVVA